jgi:branched-chain amino acid transport system permease protein
MTGILILEQALNGLQFGLMLFLLASGLTLVFGIMDMINLAHGALYMVGAFFTAWLVQLTDSFWLGVLLAVLLTAVVGMLLEATLLRTLYARDHLSQVLATFALILIINESVRMIWGSDLPLSAPQVLAGPVELLPGLLYSSYRLVIIGVGLGIALLLFLLVTRTRMGAWVRAGASNREMAMAMGINIRALFTGVFGIGAALCAVAGAMLGPLLAVWGAFVGAILVGFVDTLGRTLLPFLFREVFSPQFASAAGPAVASIAVYVLMAVVLFVRPQGLFSGRS